MPDVGPVLWTLTGVVVAYVLLLGLLWLYSRRHPDLLTMRAAARLVPDVLRLVKRLASDHALPWTIRLRLVALIGYLAMPFDLVPDFLPVIGYADDALVIALVLRSVVKSAGPAALDRHWPGSAQGLRLVKRLVGITGSPPGQGVAAPVAGTERSVRTSWSGGTKGDDVGGDDSTVKEALQNDLEQTKSDLPGLEGKDLDQDVDDTVKQAAGQEPADGSKN